jgi:ketosteroid isomerase-like protein
MKKLICFLLILVSISSCRFGFKKAPEQSENGKISPELEEALKNMIGADKAFSEMSSKSGMKKAFLEYAADESVLLRPGYLPIVDDDVIKFINSQEDTSFTMSWEPKGADIANSLDMGYTYGVYAVHTRDTTLQGTYLSIWRKQPDGKWKFVLDTGNSGISETVQ